MMDSGKICWPGWETVQLIGRGSFGAVYEIRRDVLGEPEKAALKVISIPQSSNEIEEMYDDGYDDESITSTFESHLKSIVAEYSLMRKLSDCVNIVKCDDVRYVQKEDSIGWDIFIKMELLTPLTKALPVDIEEKTVIKIAKDLCNALDMCKKHNIIHRDIKPQNIFVSDSGDYKLGDFGIAKTVERTVSGTKIGTYKYMAPEVYNNQPYGTAADIYSLGLVLYWMLNERRLPFLPSGAIKLTAGMEEEARCRRFSGEKLPDPANGSAALKSIVLKACAFNPQNRYSSPQDMLQALEGLSNGDASHKTAHVDLDVRTTIRITATEALEGCTKALILDSVGRTNVKIPKGIKNGTVLRFVGLGRDDPSSLLVGDAYVTVAVMAESNGPDDFGKEQSIDAEVAIPAHLAQNGCGRAVMVGGKKYLVRIPAGVNNGQVIQVEATASGEPKRKLTVRVRVQTNPTEPKKEKKPVRWGLILWMLFGFAMLFAMPPVGIGCLALSLPFLFFGKK